MNNHYISDIPDTTEYYTEDDYNDDGGNGDYGGRGYEASTVVTYHYEIEGNNNKWRDTTRYGGEMSTSKVS